MTVGSFIIIPDRHKLVCSYLGLTWRPCFGWREGVDMQFGCQPPTWGQPSAGHPWVVLGQCDWKGFWPLIQGMTPTSCVLMRPFSLDTRLVISVMPRIGQHLEK